MAKQGRTFDDICKSIRAKQFVPVYFLMGEESYFIDVITNLLIDNVLSESERDFNQIIMYGADTEVSSIINAVRRYPMMSKYQLVVVKEAQLVKDLEFLLNYLNKPLATTVLVINYKYKTLTATNKLVSAVNKIGVVFESRKLYENQVSTFVAKQVQSHSLTIDEKATQMLVDFLGTDLERICKEVDKLNILLSNKDSRRITPELVEHNIGISKDYNNFELQKALAERNSLKANRIIHYFSENPKNNPIQVTLSVLFTFFSNLLICYYTKDRSEVNLASVLGLRPFQLYDYKTGLRNFSAMKVFQIIGEIRRTDARSKGVENTSVSNYDLLKELLFTILH